MAVKGKVCDEAHPCEGWEHVEGKVVHVTAEEGPEGTSIFVPLCCGCDETGGGGAAERRGRGWPECGIQV